MDAAEVFDYWREHSHIQKRYKFQRQLFEALTMLYCRLDVYCKICILHIISIKYWLTDMKIIYNWMI